MEPVKQFGLLIKEMRESKALSQERLAEITGLDRTYISLIETGKRNPTLTTILKLSEGLGVDASILIIKLENKKNGD